MRVMIRFLVGSDVAGEGDRGIIYDVEDAGVSDIPEFAVLDGGIGRCGT